jgi:hypothetical protein
MILHHVDSNSSWLEAMQTQLGGKLIPACAQALAWMRHCGLIPKHQILDNQASAEYKAAVEASGMTYELVPPKEHQCNMAEKAIQTFKDHFVGVFSSCAPSMPIHLWCQLLPQVEWQLLLLQQSRVHPNLLAYAHVYKHHDYNWHPFIPIGMKALVHKKPTNAAPTPNTAQKHLSWARPPNTIDAGSFGPPQHAPRASPGQLFSSTNI